MVLEDNTVEYNEPSSSGCIEDERDLLSHRHLCHDPEEEEVFLVDAHAPNTPNQEEEECDYKGLTTDAVIEVARDANSLSILVGFEEKILHHVLIDPVAEYMEALIGSTPQVSILCKSQIHHNWSPLLVASFLKIRMQRILRLYLMSSQFFFPFLLLLDWLHWHYCIT